MSSRPTARKPARAAAAAAAAAAVATPPTTQSQNSLSILSTLINRYDTATPSRTKLVDAFLVFLVVAGALQFVYCVVAGNYVPHTLLLLLFLLVEC